MIVHVITPGEPLAAWDDVVEVQVRGRDGPINILPDRLDFVSPLVFGVVEMRRDGGKESFVAVDGGLVVKSGNEVTISSPRALTSNAMKALRDTGEVTLHTPKNPGPKNPGKETAEDSDVPGGRE